MDIPNIYYVTWPWWPRELVEFLWKGGPQGTAMGNDISSRKASSKATKRPGVTLSRAGSCVTIPETVSQFAPEKGWLEYHRLSFWGPRGIRGKLAVSFRECKASEQLDNVPIPNVHFVCIQQILWVRFLQIHIDTDEGTSASLCHTSWSSWWSSIDVFMGQVSKLQRGERYRQPHWKFAWKVARVVNCFFVAGVAIS